MYLVGAGAVAEGASEGVGTREGHDVLVAEAHAAKHAAEVALGLLVCGLLGGLLSLGLLRSALGNDGASRKQREHLHGRR